MVQVERVAHLLEVALVGEGELVALVDDDGVVGVAYLSGACAEYQFAVSGDGEGAALLVDVLAARVFLPGAVASRLEVGQGAYSRLQ